MLSVVLDAAPSLLLAGRVSTLGVTSPQRAECDATFRVELANFFAVDDFFFMR